MNISRKTYTIGIVISIFLLVFIILTVLIVRSSDNDSPTTNPPITTDPDAIPLPFRRALIVKINNSALWARDIDGDDSIFLIKNWTLPFRSFDFYQKKNIYFGSTAAGEAITTYSKRYSQLTQPGNWSANQIAVDNVHEKVYVLDGLAAKVNMFDVMSSYYNIISIDLNQPKDIAVDPVQGYLFILQLASILKINLDGSSPDAIIERTDILAFDVDTYNKRIYFATTRDIQSADYSGQNFVTAKKIASASISLAILNDELFWLNPPSDYEKPKLWHCKIINEVCQDTLRAVFDDDAIEIKVYNFDKPQVPNQCKSISNCEHMCVNSDNQPRCVCTVGWQLKSDSKSCEPINDFLVYVQGYFVKGRVLDSLKNAFSDAILPLQLNFTLSPRKPVLDFDFDVRNHKMIFSDRYSISKINLKPGSQQILMGGDFKDQRVSPTVDWITRNVYFVRTIYPYFTDIAVQNIEPYDSSTADNVIFFIRDQYIPTSLVVHPNRGYIFIILSDGQHKDKVRMERAHLDGTNRTTLGSNLSISDLPNSLAIDYEEDRLSWFDKDLKKVHSADLDCSDIKAIDVSVVENPIMINIYGDHVYIGNLTSIWRFDKKTGRNYIKILPIFGYESQPIRGAKVFSTKAQVIKSSHPCAVNNGGCKRYCFAKPKTNEKLIINNKLERVCECNNNEKLDADGKNCIKDP